MADSSLRLIPTDPRFVPSDAAARAAVDLLAPFVPEADDLLAEVYETPAFIDQGADLECIVCPECRARLELDPDGDDPVRDWWFELADSLEGQDATAVEATMLCCGATVPFPRLTFEPPAGIASFEISILNPGLDRDLSPGVVHRLESLLGCPLQQVWAHY